MKHLKYNLLCLTIVTVMFNQSAQADENEVSVNEQDSVPTVNLEKINVSVTKRAHRRSNEVTGLGKVVKNANDIDEEMTLNIRDLTRYDPGISVVEQGRGATSGYAMRGVDKNRVAMLVDGLSQAQSYIVLNAGTTAGASAASNGGAINEIEYENIKSIELSKGASSAEYGSGALGGAVGFRTKESSDIIKEGQDWGFDSKTAYSSKNEQITQSIAGAFRHGKFDHLAILTWRDGKETDIHSAAKDINHKYTALVGKFDDEYYLVEDDCPTRDCTPKKRAEKAYETKTASAEEYTGAGRIAPNPMDYKSQSFFYKGGYALSPRHYFGGVLERTKQQYDIRDMTYRSYYTSADVGNASLRGCGFVDGLAVSNCGVATGDDPLTGLVYPFEDLPNYDNAKIRYGLNYGKGRFVDERHSKHRYGLFYKYENPDKDGWADSLTVSLDNQQIGLDTHEHITRCSAHDNVEKCRASLDKEWSYYKSRRSFYKEKLNLGQFDWQKTIELANIRHKLNTLVGIGNFKSTMHDGERYQEFVSGVGYDYATGSGNGSYDNPRIYKRGTGTAQLFSVDECDANFVVTDCTPRVIKGDQQFVSFKDFISFGKWADLGLGVRYDRHSFKSDDPWTPSRDYNNWSWNAGLSVKPTDWLVLSYRYSNGFRVPAFYELFGVRTWQTTRTAEIDEAMRNRKAPDPEKSTNHEFGIGLRGKYGTFETSFFKNNYDGMIARAQVSGTSLIDDFYNVQDVKLEGINILGQLDWYSVSNHLPDGLYSTLAYNEVKVKDRNANPAYRISTDPILDAVQPARVIAGLGYDSPSGKWGISSLATYSKAKENDELTGGRNYGSTTVAILGKKSRSWYTYDLTGYYNLGEHFTVRAGVYNLTNRKYSTWESVRQSTINAVNQDTGNGTRFAAPGRNFVLSVEMKF